MKVAYFHRRPRPNANFSIEVIFDNLRSDLGDEIQSQVVVAPWYSNGLLPRLRIAWHARHFQADVNHVTGDTNFTALLLDGKRTVLTNHDCGYLSRTRGLRRWLLKLFWVKLPVQRVAAVTTVSEAIKQEIVEYSGCAPDKVHVIPNAVSDDFRPSPAEFNERQPRVLHVGAAPNKNLPRLIAAMSGLGMKLVVVGKVSDDVRRALHAADLDFENYVDLDSTEVVRQYQLADIVSFASLYEGFGVPIIEAQAVGRPVITSRREPMTSVAGAGACFVDPESVESIRAGLVQVSSDAEYRRKLVDAGFDNAARFQRRRIARQYLELYQSVLAGAGSPQPHASREPAEARA